MIIEKIIIENFLCYYGVKEFELSDGLNIILGENGEGKTKFFEAIEWLFTNTGEDLDGLVSAKALAEIGDGEELNVSVAITTKQGNERQFISKSFVVNKSSGNVYDTSNITLKGFEEKNTGERTLSDGEVLLNRVFPSEIRRYSMFKGERELDIFKNTDALEILINHFSLAAKYYGKYSELSDYLISRAQKALEDSTRKSKAQLKSYNALELDIGFLKRKRANIVTQIKSVNNEVYRLKSEIDEAGKYVQNAKELDTINKRIHNIRSQIQDHNARINENFTEGLFDNQWILVNFEPIQKEFSKKISGLSKDKRSLQRAFDILEGEKKGKKKVIGELITSSIPLDINVPGKVHMKEMLDAEICKVCNREAKKGSDAYEFMLNRLNEYIASQEVNNDEDKNELFNSDYTSNLITMSSIFEDDLKNLRSVETSIKDVFDYNERMRGLVAQLEKDLEKEIEDRNIIIGDSKNKEDRLSDIMKNYSGWQNDLTYKNKLLSDDEKSLKDIEKELDSKILEKDKIDLQSASNFHVKTREIIKDIGTIFDDTKSDKFNEYIDKLQSKSNHYFKRINVDSFTGRIVVERSEINGNSNIDVQLQENDRIFHKPNTSLETSMHISILFAISELASEAYEEKYPLIFDAPTSSFGDNKTVEFLNLIYETGNQKILLLKDFLMTNESTASLEVKKEFKMVKNDKAFLVKLQRPFDPNNLETINTEIISL